MKSNNLNFIPVVNSRRGFLHRIALGVAGISVFFDQILFGEEQSTKDGDGEKEQRSKKKKKPEFEPIIDDPNLPRVILIGGSNSIGYTLPVRELLKGKANVHRPPDNCGDTNKGLKYIEKWLGTGKWDVIHFNWGSHDLKYAPEETPEKGDVPKVPVEQYRKNMEELVKRMKATGAKLIFATTMPYPDGLTPVRIPEDASRYNAAALEVMKKYEVDIDDLYTFVLPRLKELQRPHNVHFLHEGYQALAGHVAESVQKALNPEEHTSEKSDK